MRRYQAKPEHGVRWGVWDRVLKRWHTAPFTTTKRTPVELAAALNEEQKTTEQPPLELSLFEETNEAR